MLFEEISGQDSDATDIDCCAAFNKYAAEYDNWFNQKGRVAFATEVNALKEILPELSKPWLEIGAGSGRFSLALGIETGIEPSAKMAEIARSRGIQVFVTQGKHTPFGANSFGAVFLIVTLCFLDSPLIVLKEINRILTPAGKLVLGLVLKESPWGKFYLQKKKEGHRFYKYATFYSFDEIKELLLKSGFVTDTVVSTLFQVPENLNTIEEPQTGYHPAAGFTVITAKKI
jgi:SAM-dependent methyltransferase